MSVHLYVCAQGSFHFLFWWRAGMHTHLQCHGTLAMCYIVHIPGDFGSDYLFSAEGKQTCFENSLCKPVMFQF